VKQLFRWLADEGEIPLDPTLGMPGIKVVEQPVDVVSRDAFKRLLGTCDTTFEGIRDRAILLLFYDSGMRLSGLVGLMVEDVDLDSQTARITLKGGKELVVPYGATTADALDRYLRVRRRHKKASLPNLWVHRRGFMQKSGVQTMLRSRAEQAGVGHVHPHQLRHTAAHEFRDAGGSEGDLMEIMGWVDPTMARRYGRSVAAKRARDSHKKFSPADRL
jgi:integrase